MYEPDRPDSSSIPLPLSFLRTVETAVKILCEANVQESIPYHPLPLRDLVPIPKQGRGNPTSQCRTELALGGQMYNDNNKADCCPLNRISRLVSKPDWFNGFLLSQEWQWGIFLSRKLWTMSLQRGEKGFLGFGKLPIWFFSNFDISVSDFLDTCILTLDYFFKKRGDKILRLAGRNTFALKANVHNQK